MSKHASEHAPAIPAGLLEDLTHSVASQPIKSGRNDFAKLFDSLRSLVASPAFGGAAAAIVVLAVASSVALGPDSANREDTFRGSSAYSATDSARVILVSAPFGMQAELEDATDFEDGVFLSAANADAAMNLKVGRVIVDFTNGTITAVSSEGKIIYESTLPKSTSGLSLEIASALTRL